jgi:hypothetical protein
MPQHELFFFALKQLLCSVSFLVFDRNLSEVPTPLKNKTSVTAETFFGKIDNES